MVAPLEKLINESIQNRNSLDGGIERSGFFRKVGSYLRRGIDTIIEYKKPAWRVTAAATLIFLVGASKKIYPAQSYVNPSQAYCEFLPAKNMNYPRAGHTATKLLDGIVLLTGGAIAPPGGVTATDTAEIYNPKDGSFTLIGNMTTRRCSHTATLLLDERVLICGGGNLTEPFLDTAEIYDPVARTFQALEQRMHSGRGNHCAVRLKDGKVFISGGTSGYAEATGSCDLFNPADNSFTEVGPLSYPRSAHVSVLLDNGNVLIAGGSYHVTPRGIAEIYQPGIGIRETGTMNFPRVWMQGDILPDDRVLLTGGYVIYSPAPFNIVEIYDPKTELFTVTESLLELRCGAHRSVTLPDGKILITGGYQDTFGHTTASTEIYNPITGHFSWSNSMTTPRAWHSITLLDNGYILVTGGGAVINGQEVVHASTEINCAFAVPKPSGWIVFNSNQDGYHDIWAIRPDGTGLRQLTTLPGVELSPQWSPDSTKIVYSSNSIPDGSVAQLWVYDWFTGTNTKIYDAHNYEGQNFGSYHVTSPAWSPDGHKILFREDASYNNPHITAINADGTGRAIVPVQSGYVDGPSWSPTGTAFVYISRNAGPASNDLWIYDFTATGDILNGVNHRLTEGAGSESTTKTYPDWTPTGNIVFAWGHNLAIINPGQSPNWGNPFNPNVTFLTNDASYPSLIYWSPSWSPDLSQIVYGYRSEDGPYDLWVIDATGGNRYPLVVTPYNEECPDWGNPYVIPIIPAIVEIHPETLNFVSKGRWITGYIQPKDYNVYEIEPNSLVLEDKIAAEKVSIDEENNQIVAKFSRSALYEILNADEVELTISGKFYDGARFEGTDTIRVLSTNFKNYATFANTWLQKGPRLEGDINNDKVVNYKDLNILTDNWLANPLK